MYPQHNNNKKRKKKKKKRSRRLGSESFQIAEHMEIPGRWYICIRYRNSMPLLHTSPCKFCNA
jgi:hypothetical protein